MGEDFFKTTGFGEFMLSLTVFHGDHPNRPKSALSFLLEDVSTFWGSMGVLTWYKKLGVRR